MDVVRLSDALALGLLRWLLHGLAPEDALFGTFGYARYRATISDCCERLRLCQYKPHSPRAGRATEQLLARGFFADIREGGTATTGVFASTWTPLPCCCSTQG